MKPTLIAASILGLAAPLAHADSWFSYEASLGAARYSGLDNGRWYQEGQPHSLSLNAPAIQAGIKGPIIDHGTWGIDYHLGGFYLGTAQSQCSCNPSDEAYARHTHHQPDADFIGSGNAWGAKLAIEPWLSVGYGFRLGFELGATYSRVSWSETVYGWTASPSDRPHTIDGSIPTKWVPGAVAGLSLTTGKVSLLYEHFLFAHPGNAQALFRSADVVSLRYTF